MTLWSRTEWAGGMDVAFFGSGEFGLPTLERLARSQRVGLVVTQPDRPAGRGQSMQPTPVAAWCAEHLPGVRVLKPERVADAEHIAVVSGLDVGANVVIAFGQKLPAEIYGHRPTVNLHGSLLPKWRGAAPIQWTILGGDSVAGVCVIDVVERMDGGDVLAEARMPVGRRTTSGELHDALAHLGPALVEDVLARIARDGRAAGRAQDAARVWHARKISRADGFIDPGRSADECRRRINGLSPWPGVLAKLGTMQLKLLRADDADGRSMGKAGAGVVTEPDEGRVRCGDGRDLVLVEVQPVGGRAMSWGEFARGRAIAQGTVLSCERPEGSIPRMQA